MKHIIMVGLTTLIFVVSSCASLGKTLVITGTTLKGVGTEFVQIAAVYKQGCDVEKTIKPEQCASFRAFGQQFQKSYPLAVQLWEAARSAGDTAAQGQVEAVVAELATSLSVFAVQVISTYGGK